MKKSFSIYLFTFTLILGLFCSCSSGPNYGKLIPKDAAVVMSLNIEKTVESSGLEGEDEIQEILVKFLKKSDFSRATREKLEEIVEDPDDAGLDLREPVMLFYSPTFKNEFGMAGAVYDAQKLEDLINIMAREAICNKVNTYGNLRYSVMDKMVLAFNDSWFFVTERKSNQMNEEVVLDEIEGLFMQDEEKSLYGTDVYDKMNECEGFFQMLFQGEGLEDFMKQMPNKQPMMTQLPDGLEIKDFAFLADLTLEKGEIKFVGENLALTSAAQDYMDSFAGIGDIAGDFNAYIPADALFMLSGNIEGETICNLLGNKEQLKKDLGEENYNLFEKILNSVKGDYALVMEDIIAGSDFPEMSLYVQTENSSWVDLILPHLPMVPEKVGDKEYSLGLYKNGMYNNPDALTHVAPEAYLKFGVKGGVSYILVGKSPEPFYKVKEGQHSGDGRNLYMRLNIDDIVNMDVFKEAYGGLAGMVAKQVVKPFDYAELYTENKTKTTFRIVMKNKEESPVKVVYNEVFKFIKNFI